jgi:hypothetical protein
MVARGAKKNRAREYANLSKLNYVGSHYMIEALVYEIALENLTLRSVEKKLAREYINLSKLDDSGSQ